MKTQCDSASDDGAELLRQHSEFFARPEVQAISEAVNRTVGFRLSFRDRAPFLHFHSALVSETAPILPNWRFDPKLGRWYSGVTEIIGSVQSAYSCVHYHGARLVTLERDVMAALEAVNFRQVLGEGHSISPGSTQCLDYEYQAFILALRRCLEYLTRAVCAYLKNDFHRFRILAEFLEKHEVNHVAARLRPVVLEHGNKLGFLLEDHPEKKKSVRDLISHYGFVSAGYININSAGVIFSGGIDKIHDLPTGTTIGTIVEDRLERFRRCVSDIIFTFVQAIQEAERQKPTEPTPPADPSKP